MKKLTSILLIIITCLANGQEKKTIENQGQQEDFWAERFFKEKYKEEIYLPFNGNITVTNSSTMQFENKTLIFWSTDLEITRIFENGIFFPQLLLGFEPAKQPSENNVVEKYFGESDTLKISNFEELKFLQFSPTVKRFRFWKYRRNFANAEVYLLELKNDKATETTNFSDFIKGARLTFLKNGWIVI